MNQVSNIYTEKIEKLNKNMENTIYQWSKNIDNNIYRDKIINLFNTIDVLNEELSSNKIKNNDYKDKDILNILIPILYGFKLNGSHIN